MVQIGSVLICTVLMLLYPMDGSPLITAVDNILRLVHVAPPFLQPLLVMYIYQ
ncbi:hypothetical protein KIPB_015707, partial [Kipferlia bialata]|eukprot:g15707.t1